MDNLENNSSRRFSSLARLYGEKATHSLAEAHIFIAGIGGVGSWAAEALARSGVGRITLADLDHVAESNINRQVHALDSTLGMAKIQAMAERIADINPRCQIHLFDDAVDADNITSLLDQYQPAVVLDCTDQVQAKIAMLLATRQRKINFIMCGGAGGKTDVLSLRHSDLAYVRQDNLLARIRSLLRKQYGFAKGVDAQGRALKKAPLMRVNCFWFDQAALLPSTWQGSADSFIQTPGGAPQGLSCAGYGSSVMVTATMGLAVANSAIHEIIQNRPRM